MLVLQGLIFIVLLISETLYGRFAIFRAGDAEGAHMNASLDIVLIAMLGGAIRVSTPFMFVALGECLTEKSGRVNLGPRRHAGARRDGRLRDLLSHRLALDRRVRGGRRRLAARRDARLDLQPAARSTTSRSASR